MGFKAATLAGEHGLTATIASGTMPTYTAPLAGMPRIHQDHRDPSEVRLILDEAAQLGERPAGHPSPLRLPERSPLADAFEVFESDPTQSVCSSRNEPLADAMIHVTAKGRFPSGRA